MRVLWGLGLQLVLRSAGSKISGGATGLLTLRLHVLI